MHEHPQHGQEHETNQQGFDRIAPMYDKWMPLVERILGITETRPEICAKARGEVLDTGTGTGRNFPYLPPTVRITGVDLSPAMLAHAQERAASLGLHVRLLVADGASLPFPDASFDTVIDALGLCSYRDPVSVIREMARVCRAEGQLLFLEHGQSSVGWIRKLQALRDRLRPHADCHWNRVPQELMKEAGLTVIEHRRYRFGIVSAILAKPSPMREPSPILPS